MALDIFMVITDERGVVLSGESTRPVYNPYTKTTVARPVELLDAANMTEQTYDTGAGGGVGAGKIVFDPFVVTKFVDTVSQATFIAQATGAAWRFVDILFVQSGPDGSQATKPYLSYRLGTVGIGSIDTTSQDDRVSERLSFVYGQLQIGYQIQKADGTMSTFAPVGWDRVRNIRI